MSLALDDDALYLLTSNAAYRLAQSEPARGIELELGVGATLSRSAFIFWSQGAIWRAPKEGGVTRQVARLPHQPQYFVSAGDAFAWVDLSEQGLFTIQTLAGRKPRVLLSSKGELSALNMIGDSIYFVQRPTDDGWRIGVVPIGGGEPQYQPERRGRRPSMLSGSEQIYFYTLDGSEIRSLSLDLRREEVQQRNLVCSPLSVSNAIYCGCVEGLFEVSKQTKRPHVLVNGPGGSITNIVSNSKLVAWTVDLGPNALGVDMLPVLERDAR